MVDKGDNVLNGHRVSTHSSPLSPPKEITTDLSHNDVPLSLAAETATSDGNWSEELHLLHEESSRDHFIDIHTRWALLRAAAGLDDQAVFIDVGCSSGYLLEDLRVAHPSAVVIGVDLVAGGLNRARRTIPGARLARADCTRLPLADKSADAIMSANMLEHVSDDVGALREFHRVLRPQGIAAVVVPAGPGLFDVYDEFLGHERRYRRCELPDRGRAAGFDVVGVACLGSLIYAPFWLVKKRNRRMAAHLDETGRRALVERNINRTQNLRLGAWACAIERRLLEHGLRLPFGIRLLCVFRRPA